MLLTSRTPCTRSQILGGMACLHAGKKRNRQRSIISLSDIRTGDMESGDTHLRTKQSIAKLMSDAERQYVAEYTQKAPA